MSEDILTRRRRLLQSATVGGAALLAGCTGLGSQDQNETGSDDGNNSGDNNDTGSDDNDTGSDDNDTGGDDDDTGGDDNDTGGDEGDNGDTGGDEGDEGSGGDEPAEPGAGERQVGVVATLGFQEQQALQQLQVQLRDGEINESEFDEQLATLLEPILGELTETIESETGGSVVQRLPAFGAVRVNGPAEALVDVVQLADADALVASNDLGRSDEQAP